MTTTLVDPRTEQVLASADDVCHVYCDWCWKPGGTMLCGEPHEGGEDCEEECVHPLCPMCADVWKDHVRLVHPEYDPW